MPKPKKNIVEAFMAGIVRDAKGAVDSITKSDESSQTSKDPIISLPLIKDKIQFQNERNHKDQTSINIISVSNQDHINKEADNKQISNNIISSKHHDHISITKGSSCISLSKSQTMVYLWFKERGQYGVFNKLEIKRSLSMPYITIRTVIKKLETVGILSLKYDGCQKIYEYALDLKKELRLSQNITIGSGSYQDHNNVLSPSLIISSSSLLDSKTTTIKDHINIISGSYQDHTDEGADTRQARSRCGNDLFESHPELGYWRQKSLSFKQVDMWAKQFDLNHEDIIQSLCYCRFDMVDNDREKTEPIKDVFNWFYRILERTGAYPKPANYKSHKEKKIEREQSRIDEIKKQTELIKKMRQETLNAQHELQFEEMLENPQSEIYKECFENIPSTLKAPHRKGTISFKSAMKTNFCKINDIELF
jgi:hypothetical protein